MPDVAEVAVALGVVDAVANDEFVWDGKADPVDRYFNFAARRFVEQGADGQGGGFAQQEHLADFVEGVAGVDDVFGNQHVLAFDVAVEIFGDFDIVVRIKPRAVAGGGHEFDFGGDVNLAHEVGHEHERAAQQPHHGDALHLLLLIKAGDFLPEGVDALDDVGLRDEGFNVMFFHACAFNKLRGFMIHQSAVFAKKKG